MSWREDDAGDFRCERQGDMRGECDRCLVLQRNGNLLAVNILIKDAIAQRQVGITLRRCVLERDFQFLSPDFDFNILVGAGICGVVVSVNFDGDRIAETGL